MVPACLMVKVLPNLNNGIQMVGFIKELEGSISGEGEELEKYHYISFNAATFLIVGITESCFDSFGIPISLIKGSNGSNMTDAREFTLESILPEVVYCKKKDELNDQGILATLDTSDLYENFL